MRYFIAALIIISLSACDFLDGKNEDKNPEGGGNACATNATFTPQAGTFETSVEVEVTSEQKLVYTTDGSEPGLESEIYNSKITINKTAKIKVRCVKDGALGSIEDAIYTIGLEEKLALVGQFPEDGSSDFKPGDAIKFEFNKAIPDSENLNTLLTLADGVDKNAVETGGKWDSEKYILTYTPENNLIYEFLYTATLAESVLGKAVATSFNVAEGAWNHDTERRFIQKTSLNTGLKPAYIEFDQSGRAAVSWTQYDNDLSKNFSFIASYDGSNWTEHVDYSDVFRETNNIPHVVYGVQPEAVHGEGKGYVSKFVDGTWQNNAASEVVLDDGDFAWFEKPIQGKDDHLMLAWNQTDGGGGSRQVYFAERKDGSWTKPANLADSVSADNGFTVTNQVTVAGNESGDLVIAWVQYTAGNYHKLHMKERRGGTWSSVTTISPGTDVTIVNPQAVMDSAGNTILGWKQKDNPGDNYIFYSQYKNTAWDHPADTSDYLSIDDENVSDFILVGGGAGKAAIVWKQGTQNSPSDHELYLSTFDGSIWTHPASLTDTLSVSVDGFNYYTSHITADMNDRGDLIVGWTQVVNSVHRLYLATRFQGQLRRPAGIDDALYDPSNVTWYPTVAIDNSRNRLLTYFYQDYLVRSEFK